MWWIAAPEPGAAAAGGGGQVGSLACAGRWVLRGGSGTFLAPCGVRSRENEGAGV